MYRRVRCVRALYALLVCIVVACACGVRLWGYEPHGTDTRFFSSFLSALPKDPKDQWKNWIAYDAPFTEQTDELNRARHFFWEVDAKVCAPETSMCV